jgi:hypothetical protein
MMKLGYGFLAGILLTFPLLLNGQAATTPAPAKQQIEAEIHRLKQVVSALETTDGAQPQIYVYADRALKEAEVALKADRFFLGLSLLQEPYTNLLAEQFRLNHKTTEEAGIDAFEQEWKKSKADITARNERLTGLRTRSLPAMVAALAEASAHRGRPYYSSSLYYGRQTSTGSGLFYLGRAFSYLDFAVFCRSLNFEVPGSPPALPPLSPVIKSLRKDTRAVYQPPLSQTRHSDFIKVNSTLKVAGELLRKDLPQAAFQEYLRASLYLAMIQEAEPSPEGWVALRAKQKDMALQLDKIPGDQSIADGFMQMAEEALQGEEEKQRSSLEFRTAHAVLESVLPAYLNVIKGDER